MKKTSSIFDPALLWPALLDSFKKLDPHLQWKNPVMFVTEIGSFVCTVVVALDAAKGRPWGFHLHLTLWLWFTVLFANFAEALAEGRGKAQAAALRATRTQTQARRLRDGREEKIPRDRFAQG